MCGIVGVGVVAAGSCDGFVGEAVGAAVGAGDDPGYGYSNSAVFLLWAGQCTKMKGQR